MTGRLLSTLKSLRFTLVLVISLVAVFLLGVIIPQKGLLGGALYLQWRERSPGLVRFLEAIGFTDIHTSPVTIALWAFFFLNLLLIMTDRVPVIWRRCFREAGAVTVSAVTGSRCSETIDGASIEQAGGLLKKSGYRVSVGSGSFRAVRNRLSPLGTILFHLSFLLVLVGAVLSFYTRFRADVDLGVGETFDGAYQGITKPVVGEIPVARFTLVDVIPTYYMKTVPVSLDVVLLTREGRKVIGINRPYREGRLSFIIKNINVAPLFIITDALGNEVDGAYVKLKGLGGGKDSFFMAGYEFRTAFHPDYSVQPSIVPEAKAGVPQVLQQSPMERNDTHGAKEITNPAFSITALKNGKPLNNGTIGMGEALEFDSHRIVFSDLRYWVKFYAGSEYGLGLIYAGFGLMVTALIIRFFFPRREIRGIIEDGRLLIGGWGEFYPSLFAEEFGKIVIKIRDLTGDSHSRTGG